MLKLKYQFLAKKQNVVKMVDIFMGKQTISGTIQGIDDNGLLLLMDDAGNTKAFASGEVSFRKA